MKRIMALMLTLLALSACTGVTETPGTGEEYGVWFAARRDSDRSDPSSVVWEAWEGKGTPTPEQLMQDLLDGPEDDEMYSPIPRGVILLGMTLDAENSALEINLSEEYGELTGYDLTIADYCITLTQCQLPQVETVQILVEGEPIAHRNRQTLHSGDVLTSSIAETSGTFLATLYFPNLSGDALTTEYRLAFRTGNAVAVEIVLDELQRGPMNEAAAQPFMDDVQILFLSLRDGLCQLSLSEEFLLLAEQKEEQAELYLYALVNSLCSLGEISQVRVQVEGETLSSYGNVQIGGPLSANYDLVGN